MVFLGTPAAAVPALRALSRRRGIDLVVTRGDRRRGRGAQKSPSEVKKAAAELGLAVACPENRDELERALAEVAPLRMGVVVAYGMLLPRSVLDMAEAGLVNVHFSLLPRWRGASPVASAIRSGDPVTGVSLMRVTEGLDTGPVLAASSVPIQEGDTTGTLTERLSRLGAQLLVTEWAALWAGDRQGIAQREEDATYAPRLRPGDARLDFDRPAEELARQVRAMAPRPGAFAGWNGNRMRVLKVRWSTDPPLPLRPGELVLASGELWCGCRDGGLILDGIQLPGRRVMPGSAWARGVRQALGFLTAS